MRSEREMYMSKYLICVESCFGLKATILVMDDWELDGGHSVTLVQRGKKRSHLRVMPQAGAPVKRRPAAAAAAAMSRPAAAAAAAMSEHTVRLASDCTGLNSSAVALELADIPFQEDFCSDKDQCVRTLIEHNFKPLIMFEDIMKRTEVVNETQ